MRKPSQVIDRSRRELMRGAGAAGLAGLRGGSVTARAVGTPSAASAVSAPMAVVQKGVYGTVSLKQESTNVSAFRSRVKSVDVRNLKAPMQKNLAHALRRNRLRSIRCIHG